MVDEMADEMAVYLDVRLVGMMVVLSACGQVVPKVAWMVDS